MSEPWRREIRSQEIRSSPPSAVPAKRLAGAMDESLGFSVDATPDAAVKKQLSQKDGKAQRRREQGQAEREAKLARLIFRDESLVDKLDELEKTGTPDYGT